MQPSETLARAPARAGWPGLTLALVALATSLGWAFGPAPAGLLYDRDAIAAGEIWRLLTGHLVHADLYHLGWNTAALLLIGWILEPFGRRRMAIAVTAGIAAVDLALWFGMPGLQRYCGLSGMLNALLVVLLIDGWGRTRHPFFAAAAAIYLLKLAAEAAAGQALLLQTAWPSVPLAHVAGFAGGAMLRILPHRDAPEPYPRPPLRAL